MAAPRYPKKPRKRPGPPSPGGEARKNDPARSYAMGYLVDDEQGGYTTAPGYTWASDSPEDYRVISEPKAPKAKADKLAPLRWVFNNIIDPTGPAFREKWAEMSDVKLPPLGAPTMSPRQAYGGQMAKPFNQAALKKLGLAGEAILSSNWASWYGSQEALNTAKGGGSPMDALYLALAYAPFGVGKAARALGKTPKIGASALSALKSVLQNQEK